MKANSCPSKTLYVGLSLLSSMASDWRRVKELLLWLVTWRRLQEHRELHLAAGSWPKKSPSNALLAKFVKVFNSTGPISIKQLSGLAPLCTFGLLEWTQCLHCQSFPGQKVRTCCEGRQAGGLRGRSPLSQMLIYRLQDQTIANKVTAGIAGCLQTDFTSTVDIPGWGAHSLSKTLQHSPEDLPGFKEGFKIRWSIFSPLIIHGTMV